MRRFDLLDEYACIIVPGRPHNGSKERGANLESDLDGRCSEPGTGVRRRYGQVFYDAVMSSGACLCWISW
jgi:hypothetical protein